MEVETIKSDVGMSWKTVRLGDVCEVIGGYAFKSDNFKHEGIPLLRISNIVNNEISFKEDCVCIEDNNLINLEKFKVIKGDVLVALSGATTGKFGEYTLDDFSYLNQRVGLIRTSDKMNQKYLLFYLNILKAKIEQIAQGAAQPNISTNEIENLEIPLPPLATQKRIAEILDAADELRRKDQELLKKYDELAQAIFIDMFGDPVKNEKGWERQIATKYYEVRGRVGWKGYKKTDLRQKGAIVIGASHVTNTGYIDLSNPVYLSEEKFIESPEIVVQKNDLIFVQRGNTIGKIGLVRDDIAKATINPVVLIFRPKDVNPFFLLYLILNKEQNREFVSSNSGSAQPMITQEFMRNYYLINVPKVLQDKFGTNIKIIENQKNKAENSLIKSESLFNSLIQKAFNGELVA